VIAAAAAALVLAAGLGPAAEASSTGAGGLRAEDDWGIGWEDDVERPPRLFVSAWGGEALSTGGEGRSSSLLGAEVAWAFRSLEVGLAGYGYRGLREDGRGWAPVTLLRVTQRFPTRGGLEAGFTFGIGAGKPDDWTAWYQVALGGRLPLGPLFLAGEIGFEQYDLLRLAGGVGVAF
jgi:hypothetical protein